MSETVAMARHLWHLDGRTGSGAKSVRIRREPLVPGHAASSKPGSPTAANCEQIPVPWWGVFLGSGGGGEGMTLQGGWDTCCHKCQLPPLALGLPWKQQPKLKRHQGCSAQEQNELLRLHFILILFKVVTIDWKHPGNAIFSHLQRRRSPRPGAQQCWPVSGNSPASPSH